MSVDRASKAGIHFKPDTLRGSAWGLAHMSRLLLAAVLALLAATAGAQSREGWIRACQAEDAELGGSNGYRVCTELYVVELEQRQATLLEQVSARLARAGEGAAGPAPATAQLAQSQQHWRSYVDAHCQVVQAVSGPDSPVGDAIPSCMADAFEQRNRQLERVLRDDQAH